MKRDDGWVFKKRKKKGKLDENVAKGKSIGEETEDGKWEVGGVWGRGEKRGARHH